MQLSAASAAHTAMDTLTRETLGVSAEQFRAMFLVLPIDQQRGLVLQTGALYQLHQARTAPALSHPAETDPGGAPTPAPVARLRLVHGSAPTGADPRGVET